jgi:hypothetical protein
MQVWGGNLTAVRRLKYVFLYAFNESLKLTEADRLLFSTTKLGPMLATT